MVVFVVYLGIAWYHIFHVYKFVPSDQLSALVPSLCLMVACYFIWLSYFTTKQYYLLINFNQTFKERTQLGSFISGEYFVPKPQTHAQKKANLKNFYFSYHVPRSEFQKEMVLMDTNRKHNGPAYKHVDDISNTSMTID
mmetsp:Transcript_26113/g.25305  ORF Transcript_26113/g.25305 Transcript_26113/m.25305 type:complete len:139 (+) Transcript_26113:886-1302(+)